MSASSKVVLVAVGSLVCTLVSVWILRTPAATALPQAAEQASTSAPDAPTELRRRMAGMERALDRAQDEQGSELVSSLQKQLSDLERRIDQLSQHEEEDRELAPGPKPSEDELRAREREHTEQLVEALEQHFESEPRDATWAAPMEASIASSLQKETGLAPKQLSCQSSLCKVSMDHQSAEAEKLFMHKLVHVRELGDTEAFSERFERDDGTISTLTYVAGRGGHLPAPPQL